MNQTLTQNRIRIEKRFEELDRVRKACTEFLDRSPFSGRDRRLIVLAIDEAVTSQIRHAVETNGPPEGTIELDLDLNATRFEARLSDSRTDFQIGSVNQEEFDRLQAVHTPHRLGIFLIRKIMDEIAYVYRRGFENSLVMVRFTPS